MNIRKYYVKCSLIIAKLSNVLTVKDTIISTKFVDMNDDVQFTSNRIMIQRAKCR
jgi:hypothetical protein